MGKKIDKLLKITLCGIGLIALSVVSGILGTRIEHNRQKALELKKENVSVIAVVNMDNGVMVENEQINYASQLVSFPNDHFMVTGLADAKAGIENGTYAAYVVIPETFSASVASIENDPRKVTLVYQYNNNLVEEIKIQTINDINAFVVLLNSNIAYMYMDAIMAEFHRIQDDASTILANDNRELELLANVDAAKLIAAVQPVGEITVNNEIQPIELTTYTTRNDTLLGYLLLSYSEAAQMSKEDYMAIKEENTEVVMAADNLLLAYDMVIQDTVTEQSQLLVTGRDKLAETIGLYNQNADEQEAELRNIVADIFNMQLEADRNSAEIQLQKIIKDIGDSDNESLKDWQNQWEKIYQDLQTEADKSLIQKTEVCRNSLEELIRDIYVQGYNNALDDLDGKIDSMKDDVDSESIVVSVLLEGIEENRLSESLTPEIETYLENFIAVISNQLNSISIDWSQINVKFPENSGVGGEGTGDMEIGEEGTGDEGTEGEIESAKDPDKKFEILLTAFNDEETIENAVRETLDLFKMGAEPEQIAEVIQTYFVDALAEEGERQMERLSDAKFLLSQSMESYENSLVNYNPLQYIEDANLGTYLNDIEINAGEMLDMVEQNNSDYMQYATEMYTKTTEHTNQVRSSLEEANTQTVDNVKRCINDLILSRTEVNSQNVNMLEGFSNALKYTRVESQGNVKVYDYIVNPVVSRINGQDVANAAEPVMGKESSTEIWIVVVLGIGIILCLTEVVFSLRQQNKKPEEEREDVF